MLPSADVIAAISSVTAVYIRFLQAHGEHMIGKTESRTLKRSVSKHCEQTKDEIYRQMLRLEAGREDAEFKLAISLLRAWTMTDSSEVADEFRTWLNKISPIALSMIEFRDCAFITDPKNHK